MVLAAANLILLFLIIISCIMSDIFTNGSIFIRYTNTTLITAPKIKAYTTFKQADKFNRIKNIIEAETKENGYIFTIYHDAIYYFATGRKNPTKYYFVEAYVNSDERQLEVIRNLAEKDVRLIISRTKYLYSSPAPLVEEYIKRHYQVKEIVGDNIIFIKLPD